MVMCVAKSIIKIKRGFKSKWQDYLIQSILAFLITMIMLYLITIEGSIIIASLASSIFILFAIPHGETSKSQNIFLGYSISLIVGSLCALIPHSQVFTTLLVYSMAVGISIFIMAVFRAKHPPSAGVSLSFVIHGFSITSALALASSILLLILVHHLFRNKLKDII